jgi:invasion protein IalB
MTVKVELPAEPRNPTLLVQMPLGLHLPGGLTLKVDQGQPLVLEIQSCDPNGCYAGTAIDAALLSGLKAGNTLHATVQSLARETIDVPVPLAGFSAAYARIE